MLRIVVALSALVAAVPAQAQDSTAEELRALRWQLEDLENARRNEAMRQDFQGRLDRMLEVDNQARSQRQAFDQLQRQLDEIQARQRNPVRLDRYGYPKD